jgi:hypothetical protein
MGRTLSDIGGNISFTFGKNFQEIANNVIKGVAVGAFENPLQTAQTLGTLAIPTMGVLFAAQMGASIGHDI